MIAWSLIAGSAALVFYAYALYPAILKLMAKPTRGDEKRDPAEWPQISITVPVYNEVRQVRETIESLLRIDYPAERRQILFVSDCSSDGTDEIIREYADRGVALLRMEQRGGKTAGENAARSHLTGDIVINTDASIRIYPEAVKALVRRFADPNVGVASGCDVSTSPSESDGNLGESGYVGYEMWVRDLETRAGGIVGSSGCLYAIRKELHGHLLPSALSRDFASALVARENGYTAVSVPDALCQVPRTHSLRREYRRKVRTMVRGMETLYFKRHLMNPARWGRFAWMLFSHKVCRWLVPWAGLLALVGIALLDLPPVLAIPFWSAVIAGAAVTLLAWYWPEERAMPRFVSLPAFAISANVAAISAGLRAMRGELDPIWEPTRRPSAAETERAPVVAGQG